MVLDLVKLRTLVVLRDRATMTAAAAALGYTTGAVSQQIAALESQVGQPLVSRSGRNVEFTDAGAVLAQHGTALLAAERTAREAVAALAHRRTAQVRIGVFGTAAAILLPPALAELRTHHPGIVVRSVELDVDAAAAEVAGRGVDLAFGVDYPDAPIPRDPDVMLLALRTEDFRLAVSTSDGERPEAAAVSLSEFRDEGWLLPSASTHYGLAMRMACRRAGFEPRVEHEVTDTATTLAMAAAGLGIAPVTQLMLDLRPLGLETVPVAEPVRRVMVLAFRRRPRTQPGLEAVIETIQRVVAGGLCGRSGNVPQAEGFGGTGQRAAALGGV